MIVRPCLAASNGKIDINSTNCKEIFKVHVPNLLFFNFNLFQIKMFQILHNIGRFSQLFQKQKNKIVVVAIFSFSFSFQYASSGHVHAHQKT